MLDYRLSNPGNENFAINRRIGGSFAFCIEGLAP